MLISDQVSSLSHRNIHPSIHCNEFFNLESPIDLLWTSVDCEKRSAVGKHGHYAKTQLIYTDAPM